MIVYVYGWATSLISSKRPKEIECFECHQKGQMFVRSYARTWHLCFIPIFPYKLWQEISCVHCHAEITFKEMGPELKEKYSAYKKISLPRPWHFSGVILVILLFLWGIRNNSVEKEKILSRAEEIKVNRIIEYRIEEGVYSTMKVCGIQGDQIILVHNMYEVANKREARQIRFDKNYGQDTLVLAHDTLVEWVKTEKIFDIYW